MVVQVSGTAASVVIMKVSRERIFAAAARATRSPAAALT
jgi:hypothetical protein